ncbi:hypothetical protein EJB05_27549, partial [Eragrostis curvula]
MGFLEAVQWWEDWQLRLLVLASLFIQYFLFVAALLRKRRIHHWFRALIWLAYQGCDVVVIYALATLFNIHKDQVAMDRAHIDTLWAPILLMHLGGQDAITAYSIEDNENWRRHLLISVSQITIAIYVFRKSWWSNDRRLLRAAILLFVPGILKCLEKPWALKNATVTSIMSSPDSQLEATLEKDIVQKDILSLDKYVEEAATSFQNLAGTPLAEDLKLKDKVGDEPYHLFFDLGHPYFVRLKNLQELMAPRGAKEEAHRLVRSSLSRAFDRLYTKHKRSLGGLLRAAAVLLTFAVIGLFHESRRNAYNHDDMVVTYILLCCTASLEFISAYVVLVHGLPSLDDQVSQCNLIGYLARRKNYPRFWSLASWLGCKDQLDRFWCTEAPEPSAGITKLVYEHIARGWKKYMNNAMTEIVITGEWEYEIVKTAVGAYRRFNDSRGQRTLEWEKCALLEKRTRDKEGALKSSLRLPFDESVLLWHLATEFCYFEHVDTGSDATRHSRVMSNYMVYLLFVNPEMLVSGARRSLFTAAYRELEPTETMLESPPKTKDEMARKIIEKVKSTIGLDDLVHRAWELAHELMELAREVAKEEEKDIKKKEEDKKKGKEEQKKEKKEVERKTEKVKEKQLMLRAKKAGDDKMWAVIQGVWVEMLCFSAGRCRGYLHAKSLGKGGEYLSYVWLLLSYMGMETMPEKMQRPKLPVEGDLGGLVKSISEEIADKPAQETNKREGEKNLEEMGKKNKKAQGGNDMEPSQAAPAATTTATTSE